jgi:hypothetical protein
VTPPWAEHVQLLNTEERRRNGENGGREEEEEEGVERTDEAAVETMIEADVQSRTRRHAAFA